MRNNGLHQKGSVLSTLLFVAVLAYVVYVVLQYVPIYIESSSVDSILSSVQATHRSEPFTSISDVERKIDSLVNINDIRDMREYFKVDTYLDEIRIDVTYNRDLNLLFQQKKIRYEKHLMLPLRS